MDELCRLQVKCCTNGAHADSVVECPHFRAIIDFCIKNADLLKGFKHMGRRRFVTIQCASFQEFLSKVFSLVDWIRQWYIKRTGSRQRFIIVLHDVWDAKRKQINGLSIFVTHPETLVTYRIPIALTPPRGKKQSSFVRRVCLALSELELK